MTQYEREELVERYLSGEMSSAEEGEFFLVAAVDGELQRTLKAYRIMDRAMMNDRETAVGENSDYRGRVMGMLAASHTATPAIPAAQTPAAPTTTPPAQRAPSEGGNRWRGISASLLGASLVGGMIIAVASMETPSEGAASPGIMQQPPTEKHAPAPTAPVTPTPVTGTVDAPLTTPSPRVKNNEAARSTERTTTRRETAKLSVRKSDRNVASETVKKEEEAKPKKRNAYIQLPPAGSKDVKIPVEVENPNK